MLPDLAFLSCGISALVPFIEALQGNPEIMPARQDDKDYVDSPTRIIMPTPTDERDPFGIPGYSSSQSHLERIESSSYDESSIQPPELEGDGSAALDELWWSLRRKKEQKMAKERAKVRSLEEHQEAPDAAAPKSSEGKTLKRQKSVTSFRESPDRLTVVASFDIRGCPKENVHVSFQRHRLVVTWGCIEVSEWEDENGVRIRERTEKNFQRTIPLPEGTRFEEITGAMSGKHLLLRYPNSRSFRVVES